MRTRVAFGIAYTCCIATGVIGAATRLSNPDMSETRLLIEFWPRWLVAIALSVAAVCVARWVDRR